MDVFVSPDGFMPLRTRTPVVNVIHDINFFHRPADLPFFSRNYYNFFFPRFAKKATRLGTVSEYSALDISQSYKVEKSKIDVYHNGVNNIYKPISEAEIKIVRSNISGGFPYFIFVGTLHPRKNVANLLKAYDKFMSERERLIKIIIVGEKMFLTADIQQVLKGMKYKHNVIFTGRLSPSELHKVMAASLAMTFIPYFEGFGIPVIEAMKCGVPVITSDVTSLPEVGGDAVLYSDPDDVDKIAENMARIADDKNLRNEYSEKGLQRVEQFSWDHTAEKFWQSIEKVLNGT
jgi:glycosyltransferase involved in cell wall biosynthesis